MRPQNIQVFAEIEIPYQTADCSDAFRNRAIVLAVQFDIAGNLECLLGLGSAGWLCLAAQANRPTAKLTGDVRKL